MKKNKTILIITLLLLAVAAYFLLTERSGTIRQELRDFAVEDTASITKIFIADKFGHAATVTRESPSKWKVNGKFTVRPDAINLLLKTMKDMEVRSPAGKNAYNNIMKDIATKGLKVEIYQKGKLAKTYYVGGGSQDQLGTFMYLENSTVPFVIHIPGFDGYLTPRYILTEEDWKLRLVMDVSIEDIQSVIAEDLQKPENSTMVTKQPNGDFLLSTYPDKKAVQNTEQNKLQHYMSGFTYVTYEVESYNKKEELDSVKAAGAFRRLTVTDKKNNTTVVSLYRKPITDQSKQMDALRPNIKATYDLDRILAQINNEPGFVVVQYFVFDKFFKSPSDFLITPSNQKKK